MNPLIFAQASTPPPVGPSILSMLPMFVLIIVIFYFIVYRPQQKEQKRHQTLLTNIKKGDKVVFSGGIHGVVAGIKEKTVLIKVSDEVKLEVNKNIINYVEN